MMLRRLLVGFLLVISATLYGQQVSGPVFWELSGKDLPSSSYIFPVIKSSDPRIFNIDDKVFEALNSCEAFASEAPYSWDVKDSLPSAFYNPENAGLADHLNSKKFEELERQGLRYLNLSAWDLNLIKPLAVRLSMEQAIVQDGGAQSMTQFMQMIAVEEGKEISHLLEKESYVQMIDELAPALQGDMLVSFLSLLYHYDVYSEILARYYLNGEYHKLQVFSKYYENYLYYSSVVEGRSSIASKRIKELASEKSFFFMVDAAFLPGDDGILQQLESKGYSLRAIGTGQTYSGFYDMTQDYGFDLMGIERIVSDDSVVYYDLNVPVDESSVMSELRGWYNLVSYNGGFEAWMPERPVITTQRSAISPNQYLTVNLYKVEDRATDDFYSVSYSDYPDNFDFDKKKDFFGDIVEGAVASIGGILLLESNISNGDMRGREIELAVDDDFIVRSRFYLIDHRFYQIMVGAPKARAYSEINNAFMYSLKVMNQQDNPWFKLDLGAMNVDMPEEPKLKYQEIKNDSQSLDQYSFYVKDPKSNLDFFLSFSPYDLSNDKDPTIVLNSLIYTLVEDLDGVIIKETFLQHYSILGRELDVGLEDKVIRFKIFYFDNKLYQFVVSGPEDSAYSGLADRFLKSVNFGSYEN